MNTYIRRTILFIAIALALAMLAAGCTPTAGEPEQSPATGTPTEAPTVPETPLPIAPTSTAAAQFSPANMDSVEVSVEADEIVVLATGTLPNGCTEVDSIDQTINDRRVAITIMTREEQAQACTQALETFEEIIRVDRSSLPAGEITVQVNQITETVMLVDSTAALSVIIEGEQALVTGQNFPPNTSTGLAVARPDSDYEVAMTVTTGANGAFESTLALPKGAEANTEYLIVANVDGQEILSAPFVLEEQATFTGAEIFLIALEDAGASGEEIGCGDSLVPVEIVFNQPTTAPLTAAFESFLAIDSQFYGQSGLYNPLHQADLQIVDAAVIDGTATVELEGDFAIGGACDAPRVAEVLRQTAAQFSTVDEVNILINGQELSALLDARG